MKKLNLSLNENAVSSLVQGIRHFTAEATTADLKFAVLHVFNSIELFLKERLAREHEHLIFRFPENAKTEDPETVNFKSLIERLKSVGVELSLNDLRDLNRLRKARNKIQHYKIHETFEDVQNYVGKGTLFLEEFLSEELGQNLIDLVDNETYRVLQGSVHSYEDRLRKAKQQLNLNLPGLENPNKERNLIDHCPACDEETLLLGVPSSGRATCFFCAERFFIIRCEGCSNRLYSDIEPQENGCPLLCGECTLSIVND